jgi:hypothetical protein
MTMDEINGLTAAYLADHVSRADCDAELTIRIGLAFASGVLKGAERAIQELQLAQKAKEGEERS